MANNYGEQIATRREIEQENLKKRAGKCSRLIFLLGLMAISLNLLVVVCIKVFQLVTKNNNNILQLLDKEYINIFLGMVPCIIIDLVIIYIGTNTTNINLKNIFKKSIADKKVTLFAIMSVGGVLLITTTLNAIYMVITQAMGITTPSPDFSFPKSAFLAVIYIAYVCLIGPILEEIIFRGIILNYIKPYGKITAIIFSAILFTMFHLNLIQFMTPLLLGVLLAFVAIKTDSVKASIIIHIFNNTVATVLSLIYSVNIVLYGVIIFMYIVFGMIALVFFIMKYKDDINNMILEEIHFSSLIKKIGYCFCNLWAVIYVIFYVIIIMWNLIISNVAGK